MADSRKTKDETFNFRIDPDLKAAFTAAAGTEDRPAAQVLRDFMRGYVRAREKDAFAVEAGRQARLIAKAAANAESDEARLLAELGSLSDDLIEGERGQ